MFDWRCFARLDSCIKHVGRAHAYHACSVASLCPLIPRLFLRTPLVEYFKDGERGKSFLDVAEIEEIETDETPSRKRKQRKGKEMKRERNASFDTPQYLETIVMSNSHHFAVTWCIFDHQFLYDVIVVSFSHWSFPRLFSLFPSSFTWWYFKNWRIIAEAFYQTCFPFIDYIRYCFYQFTDENHCNQRNLRNSCNFEQKTSESWQEFWYIENRL